MRVCSYVRLSLFIVCVCVCVLVCFVTAVTAAEVMWYFVQKLCFEVNNQREPKQCNVDVLYSAASWSISLLVTKRVRKLLHAREKVGLLRSVAFFFFFLVFHKTPR